MVRKAEFSLGSSLEKLHEDFSLDVVSLSLGFKSTKPDGILLQNSKNVRISFTATYTIWSNVCVFSLMGLAVQVISKENS